MRKLAMLLVLGQLTITTQAQDAGASIRNLLAIQEKAWNDGDLPGFMEGYWKSDSLLFVGKNGPTYGWQKTLDNYQKNYASKEKMGILHFDILELRELSGNTYFMLGKWQLTRQAGDVGGYFTLLFKKMNDGWKIVADHSS